MTDFYTNLAATALRLLTAKGGDVTLRQSSVGTYDPALGTSTVSTTDTVLKGALFDFSQGTTMVRGTLVQAQDKQLLLEARDGLVPTTTDVVVINDVVYTIVSRGEINPAGTPVVYDLHVRK